MPLGQNNPSAAYLFDMITFGGSSAWTKMYRQWLSEQRFDHAHQRRAFKEPKKRVQEAQARVVRLESALGEAVDTWHCAPLVSGLSALRGIQLVSDATLVAETGDLTRFDKSALAQSSSVLRLFVTTRQSPRVVQFS